MTCAMPGCSRDREPGKKLCWPCWAKRRDLSKVERKCDWCGAPAVTETRGYRKLMALCWEDAERVERLKDRHFPKHSMAEIEDSYDRRTG